MAKKRTKPTENYNDLSISELEALLQQDYADADETPDEDRMLEITAAILRKEQDPGAVPQADVERAWCNFQQFYMEEDQTAASEDGPLSAHRQPPRIRRRLIALFRYVAAAALVASLLFLTAFATIADVRDGTLKFLVEVTGAFTHYRLVPKEADDTQALPERLPGSDTETLLGYQFPQMPEGFSVVSEQKSTNQAMAIYTRDDGAELHVSVCHFLFGTTSAHTGDADVQNVIIQGYEGQLQRRSYLLADGSTAPWSKLLWGDTEAGVMVSLTGYRIEGSMLVELAQQAHWVGWTEHSAQPVLLGCTLPQPPEGFWLESYGESDQAHYARYRKDTINVRTLIYFRISDKPFQYEDYAKTVAKYGRVEIGTQPGIKITYPIYRRVTTDTSQAQEATILMWENTSADDGKTRYLWVEGFNVPEETLIALAGEIQFPRQ